MKRIQTYKLFLESEDLDYTEASSIFGEDKASEMIKEFSTLISTLDEKSKLIAKYKDELSHYLSNDKDKNTFLDDAFVSLDLVNKNISDLKSNLDSIDKSLGEYLNSDKNILL